MFVFLFYFTIVSYSIYPLKIRNKINVASTYCTYIPHLRRPSLMTLDIIEKIDILSLKTQIRVTIKNKCTTSGRIMA